MSPPLQPLNCPNCAAPLPPGSITSCPYCSTAFHQSPNPGPTPSAADRIAAELAIQRLTQEIEETRAKIEKVASDHSTRLGCGCLGLGAAIFGIILFVAAFSSRNPEAWPGIVIFSLGAFFAHRHRAALHSDPAAPLKLHLARLQTELKQARLTVRSLGPT
jgi:hypothetical protein